MHWEFVAAKLNQILAFVQRLVLLAENKIF